MSESKKLECFDYDDDINRFLRAIRLHQWHDAKASATRKKASTVKPMTI
jgi:hypothetical protein